MEFQNQYTLFHNRKSWLLVRHFRSSTLTTGEQPKSRFQRYEMKKITKWILSAVIVFLLLGTAVMVFGFLLPYTPTETSMPDSGVLTVERQPDGQLLLSWPAGDNADLYRVEILEPLAGNEPKLLYREFADTETGFLLPEIPAGMTVTLRVTSVSKYKTLLQEGVRFSENALETTDCFHSLPVLTLTTDADANEKTFYAEVQDLQGLQWHYRLLDDAGNILAQQDLEQPSLALNFGKDGSFPMPEGEARYQLLAYPLYQTDSLRYLDTPAEPISITEEVLTVWDLAPMLTRNSKYTFTLTWNETRGMDYEVQRMEQDVWQTVAQIPADGERSYTSPRLEPDQICQYRVVSINSDTGEYAAVSDPMIFEVKPMTSCVTVWPVKDLTAYSDSHWQHAVDTATAGKAYYALELVNGMFAVRIGDDICYIDSNYCMVNLPEYIGELCSYNITNSAYSIYAVHEFGIPEVTGVVTAGYEDVYQDDGSFLVPLLYPTAQKLYNAAKTALAQGYRLKIYDSFRPYIATREIYDLTEQILYNELPQETYTGQPRSSVTDLPETPRPGSDKLDYGWVMTGHNYVLNAFLARTGSMHNLGIALDLTLEDVETGKEIPMQSSMHDLSQYSVLSQNNEAANTLGDIMHGAGFGGLVSEWWHFQDNNAKASLSLPYVQYGVDAACWVKDDLGWKYRTVKGSFHTGETVNISGTDYTFDENGYVIN